MSAAAIAPLGDENAARSQQRYIAVHLTGFAPGCERIGIDDPRRWKTFFNKPPALVVRSVLSRIRKAPAEVATSTEVNGDVNLLAHAPEDLAPLLSSEPGDRVPHAIIWEGLSEPELKTILAGLAQAGWKPAALQAPPTTES